MKKFSYPFMEDFLLTFPNKRMEEEYNLIQGQTNVDNTKVTLYFVVFLLLIPGVPALIDGYYWDAGITGMVGIALILINFLKIIPRQYVQFLIALVICSFDDCLFLLPSNNLSSSSKGLMFFRGYAFASINVALVSRFATLWQKVVFLIFGYVFRFVLVILLDPASAQVQTIIRHIYIDLFIIYTHFLDIKKKRQIFRKFYEYREELTKFKELLANYLPQSISIFKDLKEKPLFLNKSFAETFDVSQKASGAKAPSLIFTPVLKPKLKDMTVDLSSVSEIGAQPFNLNLPSKVESFENVFAEIKQKKILDQKAVSLSASTDSQEDYKAFEVILIKIKWDSEDAVAIILNDITNQEKIIHLRISDANKDRIIATVSHELRTPLNGILGILEIIRKRINDIKTLEYIDLCKDNGHLLLNLVNSLLDLNQVREGKLTTNPTTIEVRRVLEDVIKLFAFQCNQKGITINLQVCQKAPKHMYTDENRLKQILINLISNSLKFTSKGGITVELDQDPNNSEHLQISVIDTGIGIKEEDKGKLFQMYEKIEHGRSVNKNGVGLGLTISNTLAGILSGRKDERVIEVESEVNKGSKFSFKILKNLEYHDNSLEKDLSEVSHHNDIEEHDTPEDFSISKAKPESTTLFQNIPTKIEKHSFLLKPMSTVFYDRRKSSPIANLSPLSGSCESSEAQQFVSNNTQRSNQRERGCVLIVDDNPFNILVAQNILQTIGYTSEIAQGGQEAIEIVKQRGNLEAPFTAILMDCQMPIIDGFEATRILKDMIEKEEVPNSPIIALTANSSEENIKRCYESGMVNCLAKPLLVSELEKAFLEIIKL